MKNNFRIFSRFPVAILFSAFIVVSVISCRQQPQTGQWEENTASRLRVYFFHLNDRCPACTAIEVNTQKVLNNYFKPQMDSGIISFRAINIQKKENREIIEKYQVSYTTLLLIRPDGSITDFTSTSLNFANMNPSKFEELLRAEIETNLR